MKYHKRNVSQDWNPCPSRGIKTVCSDINHAFHDRTLAISVKSRTVESPTREYSGRWGDADEDWYGKVCSSNIDDDIISTRNSVLVQYHHGNSDCRYTS